MRAIFGVVSLLIALAVVGLVAMKQLRATSPAEAAPASAAPAELVVEPSRQLPKRVQADVTKALEQGAAARKEAADQ